MDDEPETRPLQLGAIAAAVIGNALEWYDFVIFGYFATVLSNVFFPGHDSRAALLMTLATFGAGFVTRPIGGLFFGIFADRRGRKAALQLVILMMTLAVATIAFAPSYATSGLFGPLLVLVGRLLQGFATGGEFASATSFLVEAAPPGRRGLYGSLQMAGQGLSILLGALIGIVLTRRFSEAELAAWAWRLPFFVGLLIGPVGLYIRRHMQETTTVAASARDAAPRILLATLIKDHSTRVLAAFGTTVSATIFFYVILVYMPSYGKVELGLGLDAAFVAQASGLGVLIVLTPLMGMLSDRIGRRPLLQFADLLLLIGAYPMFLWLQSERSLMSLAFTQIAFCVALSGMFGALSTALAEQFPQGVRSTGLAVAYNIAVMIFGGFAPFVVTWLIKVFETPTAPAYYLIFGALVGLASSLLLLEHRPDARS